MLECQVLFWKYKTLQLILFTYFPQTLVVNIWIAYEDFAFQSEITTQRDWSLLYIQCTLWTQYVLQYIK